jgi:hypothetical protein
MNDGSCGRIAMRRALMIVLCGLGFLSIPAPAHAWWDFIEQLSGPGPFWAVDVQLRLFCWPTDGKLQINSGGGIVLSACKNIPAGKVRRAAIDFGTTFGWTGHDQEFAGSNRIYVWLFEPSFTYNVFSAHPRYDFLDVAAGVGAYVFTSKGMPASLNGYFVEPVRFELHPTSNFKQTNEKLAKWIPSVRFGFLAFPSGFDTVAFADTTPKHIDGADWVFNAGIYFNFNLAP